MSTTSIPPAERTQPSGAAYGLGLLGVALGLVVWVWMTYATGPDPRWSSSPTQLARVLMATGLGWLLLVRSTRRRPVTGVARRRIPLVSLLCGIATVPTAIGIAVMVPVATNDLFVLERGRLGLLEQVQALVGGYADPAATRLVAGYAAAFLVLTLVSRYTLPAGERELS